LYFKFIAADTPFASIFAGKTAKQGYRKGFPLLSLLQYILAKKLRALYE
jgi:hypothetical protein